MNILILKLGATGDVVRTTTLLRRLNGSVTWVTSAKNAIILEGIRENVRCISWPQRQEARDVKYDLVINLEDTEDVGEYLQGSDFDQLFGAYLDAEGRMRYTDNSRTWFDLSLISNFGRQAADKLKLANRLTYQELVFGGLGLPFRNDEYVMPKPIETGLSGDVAIAAEAGPVWPMKKWAHYDKLKEKLEAAGLVVNLLPARSSLLEHLCDVKNHRCLVGGDSLPMHLALGTKTRCVTVFTCTSPWEIHSYGLQTKIVSPLLEEFFYGRTFDIRATTAISTEEVFTAVIKQLGAPSAVSTDRSGLDPCSVARTRAA